MPEKMKQINFKLGEIDLAKLKKMAGDRKITMTELVREMIDNAYTGQRGKNDDIREMRENMKKLIEVIMKMQKYGQRPDAPVVKQGDVVLPDPSNPDNEKKIKIIMREHGFLIRRI
jgi:hypothetical protein